VGATNGTGSAARFYLPYGVAVDSAGNVYVADAVNCAIRKVTAAGVVTTLAGGAGAGTTDGTGSAAHFNSPRGVAVDGTGNVYVADTYNHTIRKVTAAGVVITLAGTAGIPGSINSTGTAARFNTPSGIAVDGSNVYVADTANHTIRKITTSGAVSTLAGTAGMPGSADDTGATARFRNPYSVAVDGAGNIYVADEGNRTIRKLTTAAVVTTLAGTAGMAGSTDGADAAARFNNPCGVAVDSADNVYVADTENDTIRKITTARVVTTLAGTAGTSGSMDDTGAAAHFDYPRGVATDSAGSVYVADSYNHTIRQITAAGVVTTLAGTAGMYGSADGSGAAARFYLPRDVATDSAGNVYVADTLNSTIRKITAAGVVTTLAGTAGMSGSADSTGAAARFNRPYGVAVDSAGNVYVADTLNSTIRKITAAGVVTTLAGTAGMYGSADGSGMEARFRSPYSVAVDGAGNIYVADTGNRTIRKLTTAGVVTTLAGTAGISGSVDGSSTAARFYYPSDVAVDNAGNVYVADTLNSTIRKVTAAGVTTTIAGSARIGRITLGASPELAFPDGLAVIGDSIVISDANAILLLRYGAQ
jgi:hypothetical protein